MPRLPAFVLCLTAWLTLASLVAYSLPFGSVLAGGMVLRFAENSLTRDRA